MEEQTYTGEGGNKATQAGQSAKEALHGLEAYLVPVFANVPHLPAGGQKFIVDVAPYVAVVFGILGVIGLVGASGLGVLATIGSLGFGLPILINLLLGIVSAVLLLMAFPGLKARVKKGWNFVFYSQVISVIGGVAMAVLGYPYGIVGTIIGAAIGFYILFEVRSHYK